MIKSLLQSVLVLFLMSTVFANDDWIWKEIPYNQSSAHMVVDENCLWVASNGGGVYRFDTEKKTYRHYTRVNDGYADNFIYDMVLDAQQKLWVATVHGLSVFSQDQWYTFTEDNSALGDNFITALYVDPQDDALWVGTYSAGLYRYDGNNWRHYDIPDLNANSTFISSIVISKSGELWIGVWGEGAYRLADGIWTHYSPANSALLSYFPYVKAIDENGTVWFWCGNDLGPTGLVEFNPRARQWKTHLIGEAIHSLQIDHQGIVWAQSTDYLYKKETQTFMPFKTIKSEMDNSFANNHLLAHDALGQIFIGTNTGFLVMDQEAHLEKYNPPGLWDSYVKDVLIDITNTKWIATRAGLHKILPTNTIEIYTDTNSFLPSAQINALTTDKNKNLWIGTHAGLVYDDGKTQQIWTSKNSALIADHIESVKVDKQGAVWVSFSHYGQGVQRFDGAQWQHFTTKDGLASNNITKIYGKDEEIWLQSSQGVSIYKNNQWHKLTVADGLLSNNITSMALFTDHAWIGSDKGLMHYDGNKFTYFRDELPRSYVSAIYEDPLGNVFIGTRDGGLSLLTSSKRWVHKNWDNGLTNTRITAIVPDINRHLWLGTEFGIGITQPVQ